MDVVLTGVVKDVLPLQQGVSQRTGNTWQSQDYVLEHEPGQYAKSVCFKVFGGEKIANMAIKLGETITAHLNIDCHQGAKGYFNDIQCWKVERQTQQAVASSPLQNAQPAPQMANQPSLGETPATLFPQPQQPAQPQQAQQGSDGLPF